MEDDRFNLLASGIAETFLRVKVTESERTEFFGNPARIQTSVALATGLLTAVHESVDHTAITIISEAREIFGEKAAQELIAQLGRRKASPDEYRA